MNGTLEERIARLEAVEAIHALKARYARLADAKYTSSHERASEAVWRETANAQAACFTSDARWFGGAQFGGTIGGRAALAEWFIRSPWRFAMHYYVAPQLDFTAPDVAEGVWRLWQIGLPSDGTPPVLLFATTSETYRRDAGEWLISSMRFQEIHQLAVGATPDALRCTLSREVA